ncbi:MAG: glycosyltransferase family 2 protein [Coriobacteriales bacterium]|jgi:glycosyltransferase involved in cell wall biosynthesis|nr:glycosyltransferase family 2 protein [Coriobacteriales bacterium]
MPLSVALAAKDGSAYLEEQVASILPQLHADDELIISVDPSSDNTRELAERLATDAPCIRVIDGPGQGVIRNFEHALETTRNERIFLCDHDDIWMPNKVAEVLRAFVESNALLVIHDAQVVDQELAPVAPSYFKLRKSGPGYRKNLLKNTYIGACMAFTRQLKRLALPFPVGIPMHDQWLGLLAEKHGSVCFLDEALIQYRRHGANATSSTHADLAQMLVWRKDLIRALSQREKELKERERNGKL